MEAALGRLNVFLRRCKVFYRLIGILIATGPKLGKEKVTEIQVGVKSYNVSLDKQTADVTTEPSVTYEEVLEKIKKTGKKVNSGEADGTPMKVDE